MGRAELFADQATIPPQFVGLAFSILGMVLGSLVPRERACRTPIPTANAIDLKDAAPASPLGGSCSRSMSR